MSENTENKLVTLDDINVSKLPELQGWKDKQSLLVDENPFIEITDNQTFQEAKKNRTALVKGRTSLQDQEKVVRRKLKEIGGQVSEVIEEIIEISKPHEDKQQAEVKRYEAIKNEEKMQKLQAEEDRKNGIKQRINEFYQKEMNTLSSLTFGEFDFEFNKFNETVKSIDISELDEYDNLFADRVNSLNTLYEQKKIILDQQEANRLESERLEKQRQEDQEKRDAEEAERQRKADERQAKEEEERQKREAEEAEANAAKEEEARAEREAEAERQRKINEENERVAAENAERQRKLDEKEAEMRADQEERERVANEEAEAQRLEALKPDREKLDAVIANIMVNEDFIFEFKTLEGKNFNDDIFIKITELKKELWNELKEL